MKALLPFLPVFLSCLLSGQTTDEKGRKQGYWKKKDDKTGKLIYEGEFRDGQPVGKFRYYHPNDSIRAILHFRKDGSTAYARLFHLNGKRMAEGKYIDKEIKDSVWTYYDEAGVLISRESFARGKKHGPSYVYLPDGKLSEERSFKEGTEHGAFKQYFDGKRIRSQGNYVNGELEGKVRYLFPNGVEAAAGFYVKGRKNGPWIYKNQEGKVTEKELYKNGELAGKKETDEFFSKRKDPDTPPAKASSPAKKPAKKS
jgi:antitoxin component YwqK of YwqJK toxin-antitoxin module